MAGMLKQALNDMYADGETFTFLMPASESIYLPFDFRTVYEQNRAYYDPEAEVEEGTDVTDASVEDAEKWLFIWKAGCRSRIRSTQKEIQLIMNV